MVRVLLFFALEIDRLLRDFTVLVDLLILAVGYRWWGLAQKSLLTQLAVRKTHHLKCTKDMKHQKRNG